MSISMHSASVPIFARMLGNLLEWLDKAETHATAKKFDSGVLLAARLAPDMLPFVKQIQIACDTAKFGVARLAGAEAPKFEDNEASFAELRERVRTTIDYVQSVPAGQLDGTEDKDVSVPRRDGAVIMKGEFYLKHFALPNFFFHVTTAYALLRHNGVDLGKADFLGRAGLSPKLQ
ncbi:MAG TPA: DUF1993 domain-containing protein [Albitalea sp.]|nr:DUF1993 domain-containing protein [Albitalea sp.]